MSRSEELVREAVMELLPNRKSIFAAWNFLRVGVAPINLRSGLPLGGELHRGGWPPTEKWRAIILPGRHPGQRMGPDRRAQVHHQHERAGWRRL
jgi:hypothetical protein